MRTFLAAACCSTLLATLPVDSHAARKEPTSHVEVSKPAASLPGTRYAWVQMPERMSEEFDRRVQDPQLRSRLQTSLDKALQAKGYHRIDDVRQADLALAYRVGVRDVQETTVRDYGQAGSNTPETAFGCGPGGCSQIVAQGPDGTPSMKIKTTDIVEGGLLVEVIQPKDIRVLWRAMYRGSVRAKGKARVDLDAIARQTLDSLPKATATPP